MSNIKNFVLSELSNPDILVVVLAKSFTVILILIKPQPLQKKSACSLGRSGSDPIFAAIKLIMNIF
jgi:hypothetical protein